MLSLKHIISHKRITILCNIWTAAHKLIFRSQLAVYLIRDQWIDSEAVAYIPILCYHMKYVCICVFCSFEKRIIYTKEMIHYQNTIGLCQFSKAVCFKILHSSQYSFSTYVLNVKKVNYDDVQKYLIIIT